MNKTFTRSAMLALMGAAVLLSAAGTASADTNKNEQTSNISGPTAALLSPGSGPGDNRQSNQQAMIKRHTTNWSVIDYIQVPDVTAVAGL